MSALLPGTQVQARGLAWEVVQVEPAGTQKRFRLRCIQGDLRGTELDLLHPLEPITPVSTELDPKRAGRLRQWLLYHEAFLLEQTLGPTALLAVQPGRLDIAPYQIVPVMRAIRMSRPRLLLADGVGLGKTVQAGLVMAELIARRRAHRILIVSPAGPLLNQWHREMRTRFGLRFTTIKDAGELREARRGLVLGANPFDHVSFCLTSVDFAKQEKVLQDLERTSWDLVAIDEAHHCVRMGRAGDWEDSRRRRLAELLARQADGLLLLTATREALAELLDLARQAAVEDPKLAAVLHEIQTIRAAEPRANILVYTENTDSQDEVVHCLRGAADQGRLSGEIIATSGRPEHKKEREDVTERFGRDDDLILVSTDATAEGLNLHERCQRHRPRVSYLYLAGTFEERLLMRLVAKYERQRSRLTFVPNTLGGITTQEASTVRLLEGLAEEEHGLFKRPAREIQVVEDEPDDTDNAAYRELLAEVERAMTGFEKAAKTRAWLAEQGLNAEAHLVEEATRAREEGGQLGGVDLLDFVCAAIEDESASGQVVKRHEDGTVELDVPPSWTFGLDGLPGFDPDARRLLVTTDKDQTRDDAGRPVGYLGRAHPVVRQALDRVRGIRFGEAGAYLDRRVSAVLWDGGAPAVLLTFLCAVESENGREYERVVAVRVDRRGSIEVLTDPADWLALAHRSRQLATKGLWEQYFDGWGLNGQDDAQRAAGDAFASLAEPFVDRHRGEVGTERRALDAWLRERTEALCGHVAAVQATLFDDGPDNESGDLPRWRALSDPALRLAAFATDGANKPAQRREADGVLRLYRQRSADLDRRAQVRSIEPTLLGLLMLVPREGGG